MSEDISKIISKYKMYMSFDGNEYEMVQKVELNKIFKQIERLNNIINELEKYIIDFKEDYEKNEFQPNAKVYIYWKDLIDKIQELKGSDDYPKEE